MDVVLSNSRGPETLADLLAELGVRARAATPSEAGDEGDIVVVTVPLKNYRDVPVAPLAGKIVIDTNNYPALERVRSGPPNPLWRPSWPPERAETHGPSVDS